MAELSPYLYFSGRCEEAIRFYEKSVGAEPGMLMRFRESPDPVPEELLPPDFGDKVMHAEIQIKGRVLLLSDGCNDQPQFSGFSLAFRVDSKEEAQELFNGLADGGEVTIPLGPTFWSPCYGMCTDRFGISWMVMVSGTPEEGN
ncbi:MAG: VOC family protein [Planctomycetaceae bacterium]|nr:VOC family protein [Planctomycetaceae bacterium]